MQVTWLPPVELGSPTPRVVIGEDATPGSASVGGRVLLIDGDPAFDLSFWCGTCHLLFERLEGSRQTLSLDEVQDELNRGITDVEPSVLATFGGLLAEGRYLPMLFEVEPRLVHPGEEADYFSTEQVATWGDEPVWDPPVSPGTPYYRSFTTPVSDAAHLYEFIVPLVPPSWNERERVDGYRSALAVSSAPTAVAVSTLDVCAPAVTRGPDYYEHWGLTHFLLDGHHKVEAAARGGHRLRLLALVSVDGSLAEEAQVLRVPDLRGRPDRPR